MTDTFTTAAPLLRRPFTVHAIRWRVLEGRDGKKANIAGYITARTAIDRLNHVCPGLWSDHYEPVPGGLRCDLTIDNLTRSDVGWSSGTGNSMALKTLYSDAFKRAAVKFGVGVSLYVLPGMVLYAGKGIKVYERPGPNGQKKATYYLTDDGQIELRDRYQKWLDEFGIQHFGEPLDHGHVEGSADMEDEAPSEPEAAPVVAQPSVMPLEVMEVIERAKALGHPSLSDVDTVHMMVAGRSTSVVRSWVKVSMEDLDEFEGAKGDD